MSLDKEYKGKINTAFRELRKLGYFAKQDIACCQSCGWAEVPDDEAEKVVFYHAQDLDALKDYGYLYLAWCGDGDEIKKVFEDVGLVVIWDGSEDTRFRIENKNNAKKGLV